MKMSLATQGRIVSEETKLKIGNSLRGKNNPMFGKIAKHGERFWYKNFSFRSGWEYAFAIWLDRNNIK